MVAVLRQLLRSLRALGIAQLVAIALLAAIVAPTLGGAYCLGADWLADVAAASSRQGGDDCCAGDASEHDAEDEAPCPCPFPCTPNCAGYLARALPQMSALSVAPPAAELALSVRIEASGPATPDPRDILHVPKHARG